MCNVTFARDRERGFGPENPDHDPPAVLGHSRGGMSDSLLLGARHGGARALTPTPPSVTSASRVCLFPRYVRRIFLSFFTVCLITGAARHKPEATSGAAERQQPGSGVTFISGRADGRTAGGVGCFHLEVTISEDPGCSESS